jgi:hypothetical protein
LLAQWAFAQIRRLNFHAPSVRRERWSVSQSPMPLVVIGDGAQHIKRHKVPKGTNDSFKNGTYWLWKTDQRLMVQREMTLRPSAL